MTPMKTFSIDGEHLTLDEVMLVAHHRARVELDAGARDRVAGSRAALEAIIARGEALYGVNTGFGLLSDVRIDEADAERLQENLIRSHCAGVGEPLPTPVVRAMLLLRANVLARGYSGVRTTLIDTLLAMINADVVPVVPSRGSVGASGDLAPLAHLALAAMGESEVIHEGRRRPTSEAFKEAGITPVKLASREGLALVNGTQVMTASGVLTLRGAENLLTQADIAAALTIDALLGSAKPFDERLAALRPHAGHGACSSNVRRLLDGSKLMESHQFCGRVQDSYSLRCTPQVHGAGRDGTRYTRGILEVEVNAVTDNPILFTETGEALPGGNFHGQPVSQVMDLLAIALTDIASITERRIDRLLNPATSGLPAFLANKPGLESGFMMAQVTAAALTSENKMLSHPASVDSIPTGAGKEDHVSMGVTAALKAARVLEHCENILAIELLAGARALDLRRPVQSSPALEAVHAAIRTQVHPLDQDRVMSPDIEAVTDMLQRGEIRAAAEGVLGSLA